ncbi:hypothetical protein CDD83_4151 [Cordyceps sp. RAO-2017]|nr:hypothetical protein CDD83_4151 [Cordyceps sp. RAO-2017]
MSCDAAAQIIAEMQGGPVKQEPGCRRHNDDDCFVDDTVLFQVIEHGGRPTSTSPLRRARSSGPEGRREAPERTHTSSQVEREADAALPPEAPALPQDDVQALAQDGACRHKQAGPVQRRCPGERRAELTDPQAAR